MKVRYKHEFNWWQRLIAKVTTMRRINEDSIDFKWGYFAPKFGLEFLVNQGGYFNNIYTLNIAFIWGVFQIKLPFKTKKKESCEWDSYGFYFFGKSLVVRWGEFYKSYSMPFVTYVFDHHKVMSNGKWVDGENYWDNQEIDRQDFPYTYQLASGEIQERVATCFIEKRQWHRKWLPFSKMIRKELNINFNDEVGEETGSWKGGCIGCGYDMLEGESMEQCLRRMEKEREF